MNGASREKVHQKTVRERAIRAFAAVALVSAGYISVSDTIANVIVKVDPKTAFSLATFNGPVTAMLADQRFALTLDSEQQSDPANLARLALRQDATAAEALTVLGLQAQLRGDTEQTRAIFSQSLALSRRELQPRIWAIEEAVARGDIKDALRNYDIALRTSNKAGDLLFPILSSSIKEPVVRSNLLAVLARKPAWGKQFVDYVALSTIDPVSTIALFDEGRRINLPVDDTNRITLVNALLARELYDQAWSYYATIRSGSLRTQSRDPNFSLEAEALSPFDWRPLSDTALSASRQRSESGGLMDFFAPASTGGTLFEQMQLLPRGVYRISGQSSGIQQHETALPYWVLACLDGREAGRVVVPNSSTQGGNFTGTFTVPADCNVQTLSFVARPSGAIGGLAGSIDYAELMPIAKSTD